MRVIYLDTNHLSRLAREPKHPVSVEVLRLFASSDTWVALNWLHLQELSAPSFVDRDRVGELLDSLPIAWAPLLDVIFEREIAAAVEYAFTRNWPEVQVYSSSFVLAFDAPPAADIAPSEMINAMAGHPTLRSHLPQVASDGAHLDAQLKRLAAVVRDPREPVLAALNDAARTRSPSGLHLPRPLRSEEILELVGGISAFPSLSVVHALARLRMNDERFSTETNDVFDEWHAAYAPYSVGIALDRRTATRVRQCKLKLDTRVVWLFDELPSLFPTG